MSTPRRKRTEKPQPTTEQMLTYLHRRVSRLERNAGMHVHPHPNDVSVEEEAAQAEIAKAEKARQDAARAEIVKKNLEETKKAALHKEAASTEPIDPTDPTDPATNPDGTV